ncbi:hypothetical protein [Floridanema aerugineum]|jgi:hypothetical protein|uniref:Uncharacterized protein n=1 Tax=Floridaenema aerugineum BLCC-F46 TaxID=3153654 RepID=A0ABV4XC90_9CYAN
MESREYEFSSSQNELIKNLADKMRFVAAFLIGIGALGIIGGLLSLRTGGVGNIINGVVYILTGIWTNSASSAFRRIVETSGSDIENLMGALGELRKLYTLQYWLLIIALIFIAIALVFTVIFVATTVGR